LRRAVIFNYNSRFADDIIRSIRIYNLLHPKKMFSIDVYRTGECRRESEAGPADVIIHSGGDGKPVIEDVLNIPKLYICYSHQWKAKMEGAKVTKLKEKIEGLRFINVLEDDDIIGRRGKMPIMEYHEFAVVSSPRSANIIAISKARDLSGKELELIEALRYPDGSISIQGHPEEGRAFHILYNFFENSQPN
jgi:GMP synthase-like glutamine amidotransferase